MSRHLLSSAFIDIVMPCASCSRRKRDGDASETCTPRSRTRVARTEETTTSQCRDYRVGRTVSFIPLAPADRRHIRKRTACPARGARTVVPSPSKRNLLLSNFDNEDLFLHKSPKWCPFSLCPYSVLCDHVHSLQDRWCLMITHCCPSTICQAIDLQWLRSEIFLDCFRPRLQDVGECRRSNDRSVCVRPQTRLVC